MKVRLYVEGGPLGVDADGLRRFRIAFKQHLERLDPRLNSLEVVARGSTEHTIKSYGEGVRQFSPQCEVALLVDADAQVTGSPVQHLGAKLNSAKLARDIKPNVFLMVQCMEAWFVSDVDALEDCFGNKLRKLALPRHSDIEAVPKKDILIGLSDAVRDTPARNYHKVRHGTKILAKLSPGKIAVRSRHAKALHDFLKQSVEPARRD